MQDKKMKKGILVVFSLTILSIVSFSQNLVPNYSFEVIDDCPTAFDQVYLAAPWFRPTLGSSDLCSSCNSGLLGVPQSMTGFEYARTGNNYLAFVTTVTGTVDSYREYIEVRLISPLLAGQTYFVNFHLSLPDSIIVATDAFGAYFSEDSIFDYLSIAELPVIPQVINPAGFFITNQNGWTEVSGEYLAIGGEEFITIGNFNNDPSTDTTYVPGGPVSPTTNWSYYFIDDVCVSTDPLLCGPQTKSNENYSINKIKIYPNPSYTNAILELNNPTMQNYTLKIFNSQGKLVRISSDIYSDKFEIIRSNLPNGIYYLQLWTDRTILGTGKLIFE